jgi:hypothetical protein
MSISGVHVHYTNKLSEYALRSLAHTMSSCNCQDTLCSSLTCRKHKHSHGDHPELPVDHSLFDAGEGTIFHNTCYAIRRTQVRCAQCSPHNNRRSHRMN